MSKRSPSKSSSLFITLLLLADVATAAASPEGAPVAAESPPRNSRAERAADHAIRIGVDTPLASLSERQKAAVKVHPSFEVGAAGPCFAKKPRQR